MLPPLFALIDVVVTGRRPMSIRGALLRSWPVWAAAAIYLMVRTQSGAFWLWDAPAYYRLTFHPRAVINNAVEYLDRGATWPAVAAILTLLAASKGRSLDDDERRVIRFGVAWFASMFAITLFLPVRSSLYAVAPSTGSALAAAALASRAQRAAPQRFALVSTALIAAVAVLIPVYRMRNRGIIEPADLSTQATTELQRAAQARPGLREIVLLDDPHAAVTLDNAFGALASDAVHLFVSPELQLTRGSNRRAVDAADEDVMVFRLRDGRLIQDRLRTNGSPAETSASHPG